jgi:ribosome-binding protein aMBF1 (putative translation factor)
MAMVVYKCDLCGQVKECLQTEIDHTEYDICRECWDELRAKLQGKGRVKDTREIILLPPPREPDEPEEKPEPGEPPIIHGSSDRPN